MTGVQQAVVQASLDQVPQGARQMGRGKRPAGKAFNAKQRALKKAAAKKWIGDPLPRK